MTDLDSVRDFLAAPRCAVLSTLDAHGAPHQTVVHYFLEEHGLVVNGRPDRLWATNLRRDPRGSPRADVNGGWVGRRGGVSSQSSAGHKRVLRNAGYRGVTRHRSRRSA